MDKTHWSLEFIVIENLSSLLLRRINQESTGCQILTPIEKRFTTQATQAKDQSQDICCDDPRE